MRHAQGISTRLVALLLLMVAALTARAPASEASGHAEHVRAEILLDVAQLPAQDRLRTKDRLAAITDALASPLPLFRSFDPRETLRETLATLAEHGVRLDDSAVINFDGLVAWMPRENRSALERLPFVRHVRRPAIPVSAGVFDSEGIEGTGADIAHAAGATGAGVTVAIIDVDYETLNATMSDPGDELYTIPFTDMWLETSANTFNNISLNGQGDREHGTASAEVVYEMAPGATIKLYRVRDVAGIGFAIRHAADRGYDVIHVPLTHIQTMSDPTSLLAGGTNPFTDDIDYAVATGSTVIVAAGNEALRHVSTEYAPCEECASGHAEYLCNDASDDGEYHKFADAFSEQPLIELLWDDDHYDAEVFDLTCWSAIETGFDATKFKLRLHRFDDGSFNDFPVCPGDSGLVNVSGTERNLGEGFKKGINLFNGVFDEYIYFLSLRYTAPGSPLADWPDFRIACGTGVEEFFFYSTPGSLSDLAVVESAITVSEVDAFFGDEVSESSSHGPAASGPLKPDIGGPGIVENFTVTEADFVADWTFNGTSAASAHVAGIAALLQGHRLANGVPRMTPAELRAVLVANATDIEEPGPDTKTGAGYAQAVLPTPGCGDGVVDGGEVCDDGNTVDGDCCSATCDAIAPGGTVCRASSGACDEAEVCDGISAACPIDVALPDSDGDDACDAVDVCPATPDPAQDDTDLDGLGDACDACTGGITLESPILKLSNYGSGPGDDRLKLQGFLSFAPPQTFDPVATGIRLSVRDPDRNEVLDVSLPGGAYDKATKTGWKAAPTGTRFVFRSATLVDGFVNRVTLQKTNKGGPNRWKIVATGKKAGFAIVPPALPLRATVSLAPPTGALGECGDATFAADQCRIGTTGNTILCR